jgi:hypothetical protein
MDAIHGLNSEAIEPSILVRPGKRSQGNVTYTTGAGREWSNYHDMGRKERYAVNWRSCGEDGYFLALY